MALETYSELLDAVAEYSDRDDLATIFPTFLKNVEAKINRKLEDPDQEIVSESTASGDYTALPTDYGSMVSVSTGEGPLSVMGPAEYAGLDESWTGTPRFYSIVNNSIAFYPRNSTAEIRLVYRQKVPALTSTDTSNWLLSRAPDVYLYGALFEEAIWDRDMEAATGWKSLFEQAVDDMISDGVRRKWGAGPLAPRIRRT